MHKIAIYSTPTCPYCHITKQYFTDKKMAFEEFDVSSDQKKAKEMFDKSGQLGVPVITIDDEVIVGFNKQRIEEMLLI
ncbi:MAG: glutaredoxin domain-containing protein [bacterium]